MAKMMRDHIKLVDDRFVTKHRRIAREKMIRTTVGDLVAALVEEIVPYAKNKNEVNILVSYMLMDLSRTRPRRLQPGTSVYPSLEAHAH
jgi:hypothetical protein